MAQLRWCCWRRSGKKAATRSGSTEKSERKKIVRDFITLFIFYYVLFFANLFNMEKEERRRVTAEQKKAEKWQSGDNGGPQRNKKGKRFCFNVLLLFKY